MESKSTPESPEQYPRVSEPVVTFKAFKDRDFFVVESADDPETKLVEISGYDMQFNFNMKYIQSLEDVESASEGLKELFKKIILAKLLPSPDTSE